MTQFMWMWLHFLFWDYTQTQTAERFSITTLLTFLSNPNLALLNQLIIWMTASLCRRQRPNKSLKFSMQLIYTASSKYQGVFSPRSSHRSLFCCLDI